MLVTDKTDRQMGEGHYKARGKDGQYKLRPNRY